MPSVPAVRNLVRFWAQEVWAMNKKCRLSSRTEERAKQIEYPFKRKWSPVPATFGNCSLEASCPRWSRSGRWWLAGYLYGLEGWSLSWCTVVCLEEFVVYSQSGRQWMVQINSDTNDVAQVTTCMTDSHFTSSCWALHFLVSFVYLE